MTATEANGQPSRGERLVAWSFGLALAAPFILVLRAATLGPDFISTMLGIPAILLLWLIAGILSVVGAMKCAWSRRWQRSLLAAIPALIVFSTAFNIFGFVRFCNYLGNVANFVVMRPMYQERVDAQPLAHGPRLVVFNRGGMIWASQGIVYDETDEILLPPDKQSVGWKKRTGQTELSCDPYDARPLWDHYYLVYFSC